MLIPSHSVLIGVSVFCLANKNSLTFTRLFGGSNGNEGLGILSLSFDWQYISNPSPLWYPLQTLFNSFVGYILCIAVFVGVYYGNIWDAQKFPFLSQSLFNGEASNGTSFEVFNQTAVINPEGKVDLGLVSENGGLPYFTSTFAIYILATNLSITATFSHLLLWNYNDIKSAWSFLSPANLKHAVNPARWNWRFWKKDNATWGGADDKEEDPHYQLMLAYDDAPNWWYLVVLVLSVTIGLVMIYLTKSTLPYVHRRLEIYGHLEPDCFSLRIAFPPRW
jgi:hypothetical protein